jgi:Tol biopolymer transport system component
VALVVVSVIHFREIRTDPRALRYTIATPENNNVLEYALSPDGRYVVIAASLNGKSQLWLRALGELEAQPMPSTEDASGPFWSPDSRNVGFFAQGRLKRIAISGGQAQSLCPSVDRQGGSWNRDDVILFPESGQQGGIERVAASGGVPAAVIKGEGVYRFPVFLPDGHHFLYVSGKFRTFNKNTLYWASLDGGESRVVLQDSSGGVFAPSTPGSSDGYLLFVREDTLMAQRFNAARGELSGGEFPVAEGVALNPRGPYTPMVVSENGVLVYWNSSAAVSNEIVWFDRTGKRLSSVGMPGNVTQPSISPDGKTVAFSRAAGTRVDLWLWDLARGTDTRFTSDASRNNGPIWSPGGDRIVFRSERNRSPGDLYVKPVNGSAAEQLLLKSASNKIPTQWSPDGKFIVYSDSNSRTNWDIWLLPVDSGPADDHKPITFAQTEAREAQGQLSPDSRWLAYNSNESGQSEIYVRSFPDSAVSKKVSTAGGVQPRWRADGKEIFFVANGKMMSVAVSAMDRPQPSLELGATVPLFDVHLDEDGIGFRYDVTKDGSRFVVETSAPSVTPRLTVWSNWISGLKK